jgi:hypothetical protein
MTTLPSIQPMNAPSGHVFYLDYNYGHMENTAMNISPFLTNLQFSNVMPGIRDIDSYKLRIESTVKKLDSLSHSLHQIEGLPGRLPYGGWYLDSVTISTIRDTIGVYYITTQSEREVFNSPVLWCKHPKGLVSSISGNDELHSTWQDWLGDREITQLGGRVVVSLSDEGVNQLNEIADRVSSYTDTE